MADARKAFDEFVQYAKADDERFLDLFSSDVSVTMVFDTGKEARDIVVPSEKFLALVKQGLAEKTGNTDTYEGVQYAPENGTVKLTATRIDGKTAAHGAFVLIYGKDNAGQLVIKAMKVTEMVTKLP